MIQPTLAPGQGWASVADTSRTLTVVLFFVEMTPNKTF